jgi:hypothetical protein
MYFLSISSAELAILHIVSSISFSVLIKKTFLSKNSTNLGFYYRDSVATILVLLR